MSASTPSTPDAPVAPAAPAKFTPPSWLNTEHILAWAAIIIAALQSNGVFTHSSDQTNNLVAASLTVLTALGYTASRTIVKTNAASNATALAVAATAPAAK